jgi:hypothetical protein
MTPISVRQRSPLATAFVRRPYEINPDVIVCRCAKCGQIAGASPSYRLLKIAEDAHICPGADREKEHGPRKLTFVERHSFVGWTCDNCNWLFVCPDIQGPTLERLIPQFESLRDAAFAAHKCSARRRT